MKNEAGEYIEKWSAFFTKIPTEEAKVAVNKALEQVGKEAILKAFYKLENIDMHPQNISLDDLDKIINSLKL